VESDADLLDMIRALGDVVFSTPRGDCCGLLDEGFAEAAVGGMDVDGTQPSITCRSSDVERLQLVKGAQVTLGTRVLKVVRPEPDGTGMTRLVVQG